MSTILFPRFNHANGFQTIVVSCCESVVGSDVLQSGRRAASRLKPAFKIHTVANILEMRNWT